MSRPPLPSASSGPSFSPVSPTLEPSSSTAAGSGPISASTPPSPTVAASPERPLSNGIVASSSSGSLSAEEGPARSGGQGEGGGGAIDAPTVGKRAAKSGLNDLSDLSHALPAVSSLPDEMGSAEYPLEGSALFSAGQEGYYAAEGDEEGWETGALGLQMGGAAPVSFSMGEKRTGHCKFFNAQKGFGFVLDDQPSQLGNEEVFVHYTAIVAVQGGPGGFKSLLEGEAVEYDIVQSGKGWQAQNVTGPNGAPCIGTPPGSGSKASLSSYNSERRGSTSYEPRNGFMPGRRPSGMSSSMSSTGGRPRVSSGYFGSTTSSTTRSTYSSPASRQMPLPHAAPPFPHPYQPVPPNFQYLIPNFQPHFANPFPGGSPLHHPQAMLYPYPPPHLASEQPAPPPSTGEGETRLPLQPGQPPPHPPPPGAAYYPSSALPPGGVPIPNGDPRFFHPGAFPLPTADQLSTSPYSAPSFPYPISTSSSSAGGFSTGPPSAYPISSSQTSPAGQFLHPYPPPPAPQVEPLPHPQYALQHQPSMGELYAQSGDGGGGGAYPIGGPYSGDPYQYGMVLPSQPDAYPPSTAAVERDSDVTPTRAPDPAHGSVADA